MPPPEAAETQPEPESPRRSTPLPAGEWAALLLFVCYVLLVATPLIPGLPPVIGSVLATVLFAALAMALMLALARVATRAWHEAIGLALCLGAWYDLGQFAEGHRHARVFLGPAVNLAFLLACVAAGKLLSRIIRDRNILVPVCIVAALADLYTVFAGPTGQALQEAPKLVQKLSVSIPQPGSAAGATGHMGLAFAGTMGLGDFIFIAMFFAAATRFGFRLRRSYWGILLPTGTALIGFLAAPMLPGIPLLPFIATGFLVANWREFRLTVEEKTNLRMAGLIVGIAVAVGVLWHALKR